MRFFKKTAVLVLTVLCISKDAFASFPQFHKLTLKGNSSKILKLETTYNTRDIGGYKTFNGNITKHGVFLRSDDTDKLTENDIKTLVDYGVKTVIDLRTQSEIQEHPDKLSSVQKIDYYHVDIKANYLKNHNEKSMELSKKRCISFADYTSEWNWQKEVFDIIANAKEGCILFHCIGGGKNKTGLLAMMLLGAVDVDIDNIIYDYVPTWDLIKNNPKIKDMMAKDIETFGKPIIEEFYASPPKKN